MSDWQDWYTCFGVSPDGAFGCVRRTAHSGPCKNPVLAVIASKEFEAEHPASITVLWCWTCFEWTCDLHMTPLEQSLSIAARVEIRDFEAARRLREEAYECSQDVSAS
jgi:hypothetical protein